MAPSPLTPPLLTAAHTTSASWLGRTRNPELVSSDGFTRALLPQRSPVSLSIAATMTGHGSTARIPPIKRGRLLCLLARLLLRPLLIPVPPADANTPALGLRPTPRATLQFGSLAVTGSPLPLPLRHPPQRSTTCWNTTGRSTISAPTSTT